MTIADCNNVIIEAMMSFEDGTDEGKPMRGHCYFLENR
jgi:hypothetical protein